MLDTSLALDHIQMPARDPEGLASWYAQTFALSAQGNRVCGPDVLIVFQAGVPVERAPELHIGLHVPSMQALTEWAAKFGATIISGKTEYASFSTSDPEGNCVELYCLANA